MAWIKNTALGCGGLLGVSALGIGRDVGYAFATAGTRDDHSDVPFPAIRASTDPGAIEAGRYIVRGPGHCSQCHAANLTPDPETGIGNRTDAELARTIQHGIPPNGKASIMMQLTAGVLSDEDAAAAISYLRSLAPVSIRHPAPVDGMMPVLTLLLPLGLDQTPVPAHVGPAGEPNSARGAYLAEAVMMCAGCHSDFDMMTFTLTGDR